MESALEESALHQRRYEIDPEKPKRLVALPGEREHTLCFDGHIDTIPLDESDWPYAPLGERVDDRLCGRETTDMERGVNASGCIRV